MSHLAKQFDLKIVLLILGIFFKALSAVGAEKLNTADSNTLPAGIVKIVFKLKPRLAKKSTLARDVQYSIGFYLESDKSTVYISRTFDLNIIDEIVILTNETYETISALEQIPNLTYYTVKLKKPSRSRGLVLDCTSALTNTSAFKTWTFRTAKLDRHYFEKGLVERRFTTRAGKSASYLKDFETMFDYSIMPMTGTPIVRASDGKMISIFAQLLDNGQVKALGLFPIDDLCVYSSKKQPTPSSENLINSK